MPEFRVLTGRSSAPSCSPSTSCPLSVCWGTGSGVGSLDLSTLVCVPRPTPFAIDGISPPRARSLHPLFCAHARPPHAVRPLADRQHSGDSIHAHMHASPSTDTHLQFTLGLDCFFFFSFMPVALLFFLGQPHLLRLLMEPTDCPHLLNLLPRRLGFGLWFMPITLRKATPTDLKVARRRGQRVAQSTTNGR